MAALNLFLNVLTSWLFSIYYKFSWFLFSEVLCTTRNHMHVKVYDAQGDFASIIKVGQKDKILKVWVSLGTFLIEKPTVYGFRKNDGGLFLFTNTECLLL